MEISKAKPLIPTVVYDDACGFCSRSMEGWRGRARGRVAFQPSGGEGGCRFAGEPTGSVRLVEADGTILSGAPAVFRLMELCGHPAAPFLQRLHSASPLFRFVSARGYGAIARYRGVLSRVLGLRPDRVV